MGAKGVAKGPGGTTSDFLVASAGPSSGSDDPSGAPEPMGPGLDHYVSPTPRVLGSAARGKYLRAGALVPYLLGGVPWFTQMADLYRHPEFAVSRLVEIGMIGEEFVEVRLYSGRRHFFFYAARIADLIAWLNTQPRRYGTRELSAMLCQRGFEANEDVLATWLRHQILAGTFASLGLAPGTGMPAGGLSEDQVARVLAYYQSHPPARRRSRAVNLDAGLRAQGLLPGREAALELTRRFPHWSQPASVYQDHLSELTQRDPPFFASGSVVRSPHSGVWYFSETALVGYAAVIENELHTRQAITLANAARHVDVPGISEIDGILQQEGSLPGFRPYAEIQAAGGILSPQEVQLLDDFATAHQRLELAEHRGLSLVHLARSTTIIGHQTLTTHLQLLVGWHPVSQVARWLGAEEAHVRSRIEARQPPLGSVLVGEEPGEFYLNFSQIWALKTGQPLRNVTEITLVPFEEWLRATTEWLAHARISIRQAACALWQRAYGSLPTSQQMQAELFDALEGAVNDYLRASFDSQDASPQWQGTWFLKAAHLEQILRAAAQAANGNSNGQKSANGIQLVLPPEFAQAWRGRKFIRLPHLCSRLGVSAKSISGWAEAGWIPGLPPLAQLPRRDKAILVPAQALPGLTTFVGLRRKLLDLFPATSPFWSGLAVALRYLGAEADRDAILNFATELHSLDEAATVLRHLGHRQITADQLAPLVLACEPPDAARPSLGRVLMLDGAPHLTCPQLAMLERWLSGRGSGSSAATTVVDFNALARCAADELPSPMRADFLHRIVQARLPQVYPAQAHLVGQPGTDVAMQLSSDLMAGLLDQDMHGCQNFFRAAAASTTAGLITYALASGDSSWESYAPRLPQTYQQALKAMSVDSRYLLFKLWLTSHLGRFYSATVTERTLAEEEKAAWVDWMMKKGLPDPREVTGDGLVRFLDSPWGVVVGKGRNSQRLRWWLQAATEKKITGYDAPWLGWRTFVGHDSEQLSYWDLLCMARDAGRLQSLEKVLTGGQNSSIRAMLVDFLAVVFYRFPRNQAELMVNGLLHSIKTDRAVLAATAQFLQAHHGQVRDCFVAGVACLSEVAGVMSAAKTSGVGIQELKRDPDLAVLSEVAIRSYAAGQLPRPVPPWTTVVHDSHALVMSPMMPISRAQRSVYVRHLYRWVQTTENLRDTYRGFRGVR